MTINRLGGPPPPPPADDAGMERLRNLPDPARVAGAETPPHPPVPRDTITPYQPGLAEVVGAKLAPDGLAAAKLAPDGLAAAKLAPDGLAAAKLAPDGLAAAKLAPDGLAAAKLAPDGLQAIRMAPEGLTPDEAPAPGADLQIKRPPPGKI